MTKFQGFYISKVRRSRAVARRRQRIGVRCSRRAPAPCRSTRATDPPLTSFPFALCSTLWRELTSSCVASRASAKSTGCRWLALKKEGLSGGAGERTRRTSLPALWIKVRGSLDAFFRGVFERGGHVVGWGLAVRKRANRKGRKRGKCRGVPNDGALDGTLVFGYFAVIGTLAMNRTAWMPSGCRRDGEDGAETTRLPSDSRLSCRPTRPNLCPCCRLLRHAARHEGDSRGAPQRIRGLSTSKDQPVRASGRRAPAPSPHSCRAAADPGPLVPAHGKGRAAARTSGAQGHHQGLHALHVAVYKPSQPLAGDEKGASASEARFVGEEALGGRHASAFGPTVACRGKAATRRGVAWPALRGFVQWSRCGLPTFQPL